MKLPYWHVDAFAARTFGGNQAAVMPLEAWLPDETLLAIAAENLFAETAFVVRDAAGAADWELRWFTPAEEVRLCGHATLASGHVLLTRDGGDRVTFRTRRAGNLEVRRAASGYELALPAIATEPSSWPEAVALLGDEPLEVWLSPDRYGIYLFESETAVRALEPICADWLGSGTTSSSAPRPDRGAGQAPTSSAGCSCPAEGWTRTASPARPTPRSRRSGRRGWGVAS